ncbi:YdiU family protein [Geomonas sp. RF6]|uniref:protein adenylyltransferase SelO n=1 Tax=Geomonas sp. RF6 TaxID=2897342 RepID=UPI001E46A227|nr:YdiU family protein [Geomonas sp. RF6]UFS71184.1 YdiU family protein [Geomonas sp. RF6]
MPREKVKRGAGWNFDNSYARLPSTLFSRVNPTPVRSPALAVLNDSLAVVLGLVPEELQEGEGLAALAGNAIPQGAMPLAQAYAGHQFGYFTMLGDGRAILLGEQMTPSGERVDIQLKGSGTTPYSRRGDGRASLGPMLRECIISEAMYALGIPSTRSLAVVSTGESVWREMEMPGAILTRVADSHLRVGTFQYVNGLGNLEDLRVLAEYTLKRHFPDVEEDGDRYLSLLKEVIKRQAVLIAKWQLVGFVHGVMNTDNMALSGETIDYGPCAFMDAYNPATVFSSIDAEGRYAYGNQPRIATWNLTRFAETLLPLLHADPQTAVKLAEEALSEFPEQSRSHWMAGMRSKLGIFNEEGEDEALIERLLKLMHRYRADYTNTFRELMGNDSAGSALHGTSEFQQWHESWQARLVRQAESRSSSQLLMRKSNPALIPRNHRVEEVLAAAVQQGDYRLMHEFLKALSDPYAHTPEQARYATPPDASAPPYRTFCGT